MRKTALLAPLEAGAGLLFGALSAARRARIFHPIGTAYTATVTIEGGDHPVAALVGRHDAVVRLSRGAGLPDRFPDVLGLAVKVLNAHGAGSHQDFLTVTSGEGFPGHHLLLPAQPDDGRPYSSVLPYRNARGDRFLVGALPDAVDSTRYVLAIASVRGSWQTIGTVELADALDDEQAQRLRFSPWNTGGGIEPTGLLNQLRRGAYAGSQRARPDTEVPVETDAAA